MWSNVRNTRRSNNIILLLLLLTAVYGLVKFNRIYSQIDQGSCQYRNSHEGREIIVFYCSVFLCCDDSWQPGSDRVNHRRHYCECLQQNSGTEKCFLFLSQYNLTSFGASEQLHCTVDCEPVDWPAQHIPVAAVCPAVQQHSHRPRLWSGKQIKTQSSLDSTQRLRYNSDALELKFYTLYAETLKISPPNS